MHYGPSTDSFMKTIPRLFRGKFRRRFYGWIIALSQHKNFDLILIRHQMIDPFAPIFTKLIPNIVSVHHTKESDEILLTRNGWKGNMLARLERVSSRFSIRNSVAVVGVTREIAEYERDTYAPNKPIAVYSNGVDLNSIDLLRDERSKESIEAAFICSSFAEWHGLDKLIIAVDEYTPALNDPKLKIHLIGSLSAAQRHAISATSQRQQVFVPHGTMNVGTYRPLLDRCDFGIASLAIDRKNLGEASTLKVREMLAMGLPVFSGHRDIALPEHENFVMVVNSFVFRDILEFGQVAKRISRKEVRNKSATAIDKRSSMHRISESLIEIRFGGVK